ncbi:hypothetical protein Pcinc_026740 [Petrolisthes cinctipes]|uniref:Uncharacterized protein n=1 Tax=Petrolisthes cinctipes TaxID=88211 RepID=A0AAE1KB84_PETCI|nr:hypothetical protein Pcinc_026740 [Petrolisthes cinctipes]
MVVMGKRTNKPQQGDEGLEGAGESVSDQHRRGNPTISSLFLWLQSSVVLCWPSILDWTPSLPTIHPSHSFTCLEWVLQTRSRNIPRNAVVARI